MTYTVNDLIKQYGTRGVSLVIDALSEYHPKKEGREEGHKIARDLKNALEDYRIHGGRDK